MSANEPSPHAERQKKTRHRHSPDQLAALNELYDRDIHPSLEQRTSLAQQLGMETKTVNAWFQNKRASTKKRTLSSPAANKSESHITPPIRSVSSSSATTPRFHDFEDDVDDDPASLALDQSDSWSNSFYPPDGNDNAPFSHSSESMPKRMRNRPSAAQSHELRKLYKSNPHPSTEEKRALAGRIGMRYQSITNWFQNQRSMARKRKEDDTARPAIAEARTYSAYPPASGHPSLPLPPASTHTSLDTPAVKRPRSPSVSSTYADEPSILPSRRAHHSRRSTTPYSALTRPRRSRPEPYQLDALKDLYTKTSTPSIEERTALAQQIGMDLGRVTNWFRNLRQTSRKRAQKSTDGHDHRAPGSVSGDDGDDKSMYSDAGSPSYQSSGEFSMDMDGAEDGFPHGHGHSDIGTDDEYQEEALTPASTPPPPKHARVDEKRQTNVIVAGVDPALYEEAQKATKNFKSGVQAEDALLLLSFHRHTTVH